MDNLTITRQSKKPGCSLTVKNDALITMKYWPNYKDDEHNSATFVLSNKELSDLITVLLNIKEGRENLYNE